MSVKNREIIYSFDLDCCDNYIQEEIRKEINDGHNVTIRMYVPPLLTPQAEIVIRQNVVHSFYRMDIDIPETDSSPINAQIDSILNFIKGCKVYFPDDFSLLDTHRLVQIRLMSDKHHADQVVYWDGNGVPIHLYAGFDAENNVKPDFRDIERSDSNSTWSIKPQLTLSVGYGGVWGDNVAMFMSKEHPIFGRSLEQPFILEYSASAILVSEWALDQPVNPTMFLLTMARDYEVKESIVDDLVAFRRKASK